MICEYDTYIIYGYYICTIWMILWTFMKHHQDEAIGPALGEWASCSASVFRGLQATLHCRDYMERNQVIFDDDDDDDFWWWWFFWWWWGWWFLMMMIFLMMMRMMIFDDDDFFDDDEDDDFWWWWFFWWWWGWWFLMMMIFLMMMRMMIFDDDDFFDDDEDDDFWWWWFFWWWWGWWFLMMMIFLMMMRMMIFDDDDFFDDDEDDDFWWWWFFWWWWGWWWWWWFLMMMIFDDDDDDGDYYCLYYLMISCNLYKIPLKGLTGVRFSTHKYRKFMVVSLQPVSIQWLGDEMRWATNSFQLVPNVSQPHLFDVLLNSRVISGLYRVIRLGLSPSKKPFSYFFTCLFLEWTDCPHSVLVHKTDRLTETTDGKRRRLSSESTLCLKLNRLNWTLTAQEFCKFMLSCWTHF